MITNPILPGFNPDPSICRVGDDYYIATSTFEWYPGVQIHHSKDLRNWKLITRPLNRAELLDMRGEPDSCGVWAPCLSYADGLFWLIYTDVKRFDGNFKDSHNYLTTCETIDGEWANPIYLNSCGFDPSLFHDDDGRKWYTSMIWDHRPDRSFFGGIYLQEYCLLEQQLIGDSYPIFAGSCSGVTEAPHIYKRDGYYYLMTAEGGTGYDHAITLARSLHLTGPYEVDPQLHFLSARDNPQLTLQRAGHGDLVETGEGEWYVVHLCSRPLTPQQQRSTMGRETAIQKVQWDDEGWLRLCAGGYWPQESTPAPQISEAVWPEPEPRCDFEGVELPIDFQWLRTPYPTDLFSLSERPGFLRLYGRESLGSLFTSSLIARRQQASSYVATTCLDFNPENFQQMAGLVCYYNSRKFHYVYVSHDENIGRYIGVMSCHGEAEINEIFPLQQDLITIAEQGSVFLRASVTEDKLLFYWAISQNDWRSIPLTLDYSLLSDEAGSNEHANFTGTFVGMCCQDVSCGRAYADFSFFEYIDKAPVPVW
jgi:xylan 1,4-beta-xylosidase